MQTQLLRWTIATALVAGVDDLDQQADLFAAFNADAIAVQGVAEHDCEALADRLGMRAAWSLSYYSRTPLMKSSGIGLAVITSLTAHEPAVQVVAGRDSGWSRDRRIAQTVTVERSDHSAYAIRQSLDDPGEWPTTRAPAVTIRPQQVGIDDSRAIELPPKAVEIEIHQPVTITGTQAVIAATSFSMPWVASNVPL